MLRNLLTTMRACLPTARPSPLKFANAVGEVLTAGPLPSGGAPLSFMYYI